MNLIKKVDAKLAKLKEILKKHGIEDEREQQTIIIEIINAFAGR